MQIRLSAVSSISWLLGRADEVEVPASRPRAVCLEADKIVQTRLPAASSMSASAAQRWLHDPGQGAALHPHASSTNRWTAQEQPLGGG